jgi:alpha-amylase/alpha-mannosidase (GH57 family)
VNRYICIHGHFYQPPRENPWLEVIETQESAYPYHDWNERINAECYEPNSVTRILDDQGRITSIVNNYEKISFNFGPTLLSWMEKHAPKVYAAIIEADRISAERRNGHGNAIAQVYNHMIMPLASRRDKQTQVIWGIADFRKRFGRKPEGMWLPETAVDLDTLRTLVENGIRFTILSPMQARRVRPLKGGNWSDVSGGRVDTTIPYVVKIPSGGEICIFFYNGGISHDIAFGNLLDRGEHLSRSLIHSAPDKKDVPHLVNVATDGETYGHHHKFGEMALAYCINQIESRNLARFTNYGEFLEMHPPTHEVEIFENSSWSCAHGIERWRDNCGCNTGGDPSWTQAWRRPLREAMDNLRDHLRSLYEKEAAKYFINPENARNDYIEVILDRSRGNVERFFAAHSRSEMTYEDKVRALKLLDMQRNAMLMFTSCGWFFDEISGVENVQIMQYASKAIQYAREISGESPEELFIEHLRKAPSNVMGNGARVYEKYVKPAECDLLRVGAHYCISSIFEEYSEETVICCYTARTEKYEQSEAGKMRLATGKSTIISDITWESRTITFAVLHLGDQNISAGVRDFRDEESLRAMMEELKSAFDRGDIPEVVRLMDGHFGDHIYSLWHLFKDEQKKVLDQILQITYDDIEAAYRRIYENNITIMNFYHDLQHKIPRPFLAAAEYIINVDLKRVFDDPVIDKARLRRLIDEISRWDINVDKTTIGFRASSWLSMMMEHLVENPDQVQVQEQIIETLEIIAPLSLQLDLWKAQNRYFAVYEKAFREQEIKAGKGDESSSAWLDTFTRLGGFLNVKI